MQFIKTFEGYHSNTDFDILCEKIDRDIHLTLDNGGMPFIVDVLGKHVNIYSKQLTYEGIEKIFYGDDNKGDKNATMLLKLKDKYVYVGSGEIFEFKTDEDIEKFSSPIGNSAVPYPFAIGKEYAYFMLDRVYVELKEFESKTDLYREFYDKKDSIVKHKIQGLKEIVKRK